MNVKSIISILSLGATIISGTIQIIKAASAKGGSK